jgi:A nuclease family of the HNH/ENDO VII superfamily with conserved AHH
MPQNNPVRTLSSQMQYELDQIMKLSAVEGWPKLYEKLKEWNQDFTEQRGGFQVPGGIHDQVLEQVAKQLETMQDWPEPIRSIAANMLPAVGDGWSLMQESYNKYRGRPADQVNELLSGVGLLADGADVLDGLMPNPANASIALAAVAHKMLKNNKPLREAVEAVISNASKSAEGMAKLGNTLNELNRRQDVVLKHLDRLPELMKLDPVIARRLTEQSDSALARALSSPAELQQAIARAKFADKFIGQNIPAKGTAARAEFDKYYTVDVNNVIRRRDVDEGFTKLQVDEHGKIKEATGNISDRLSIPSKMRANYGPVPEGHQLHHLIPDAKVRDHELAQMARQKAGYDLDAKTNLVAMPENAKYFKDGELQIIHFGSHPNWSKYAEGVLDGKVKELLEDYPSLDKVPADVLKKTMQDVEQQLRRDISNVELSRKLGDKGWLKETPERNLKLSLNEPLESQVLATEIPQPNAVQTAQPAVSQQPNPVTEYTTLANSLGNKGTPVTVAALSIRNNDYSLGKARTLVEASPEAQRLANNPAAQEQFIQDTLSQAINVALDPKIALIPSTPAPAPQLVATAPAPQPASQQPNSAAQYAQVANGLQAATGLDTIKPHWVAAVVIHQSGGDMELARRLVAASPEAQQLGHDPAAQTAFVNKTVADGQQARLDQLTPSLSIGGNA